MLFLFCLKYLKTINPECKIINVVKTFVIFRAINPLGLKLIRYRNNTVNNKQYEHNQLKSVLIRIDFSIDEKYSKELCIEQWAPDVSINRKFACNMKIQQSSCVYLNASIKHSGLINFF